MRIQIRIPIVTVVSLILGLAFLVITLVLNRHSDPSVASFQFWVVVSMILAGTAGAHWICGETTARIALGMILFAIFTMGQRYMFFVFESPPLSWVRFLGVGSFASTLIMGWGLLRYNRDMSRDGDRSGTDDPA